nr:flagellar brake protein [Desulfobacula sp.]
MMEELEGLLELNKSEGIYIDIGTQVYLEIEGVNFSVTSVFIGMLKDEFMIVTLPKRYKTVQNKLYPGNKIVIKYLFDGSVFAFQTSVIETITNPIKALAIEYPKVVQQRELRIAKRNFVVIPGRVEAKKQNSPLLFLISAKTASDLNIMTINKTCLRSRKMNWSGFIANFPEHPKKPGYSPSCAMSAGSRDSFPSAPNSRMFPKPF